MTELTLCMSTYPYPHHCIVSNASFMSDSLFIERLDEVVLVRDGAVQEQNQWFKFEHAQ